MIRYGYKRTVCACSGCKAACETMPGMLAPRDTQRIAELIGVAEADYRTWVEENFRASPGATVADTATGRQYQIHTIVPAQQANGHCVFYRDGGCTVHAAAPYGCGWFDVHMGGIDGNRRSAACLREIQAEFEQDGPYARWWRWLACTGRGVGPASERRKALQARLRATAATDGPISGEPGPRVGKLGGY